jgi:hypothetical protein
VTFVPLSGLPLISQPMAVGGVAVSGTVEFEDILHAGGYSGTGLLVDDGGEAIFGTAATVSLGADVTLGDAGGAGTLMLLAQSFSVAGHVTLAPVAGAAGSEVAILGGLSASGMVDIGLASAALVLEGSLVAGALHIGASGSLQVLGTAQAALGP